MSQDFRGKGAQGTYNGNIYNCRGGDKCPLRKNTSPPSARSEAEFYRYTGIRADPRLQELLDEFRAEHRLTWRGWGMHLMWRHRSLEYDSTTHQLRLNPSMTTLVSGWATAIGALITIFAVALLFGSSTKLASAQDWAIALGAEFAYMFFCWYAIQHMVAPEQIARRIQRRQASER